jgi:crotonobetainyl-CoA:carnitine CoA-transferase CaiB-like acyl-CoA transferase
MRGVLNGLEVLDLTSGIGGPIAAMLLADHGARVTKIEAPGGDQLRSLSGSRVWHRGKRSAFLDLKDDLDQERLRKLASNADILIEGLAPGKAEELGVTFEAMRDLNPRLIHCSITPYGDTGKHAQRSGYEALVAARTGHQWEARGFPGGTIARLAGVECGLPGTEVPDNCWVGAPRQGPVFSGVPWVNLAVAYQAVLAISAAVYVRERTGRGQRVATSMLQGVLATTLFPWQRAEHANAPSYQSWIIDQRAPKGVFRCADGRWVHQWVPLPDFLLNSSKGDELIRTPETVGPRQASNRIGMDSSELVLLHHYQAEMVEAVAKFPSGDWVNLAAEVGVPLQPLRSPEEALHDPLLLADGCVIEIQDPDRGPLRQVGRVYSLSECPTDPPCPPVSPGADTEEVRREADDIVFGNRDQIDDGRHPHSPHSAPPLDGIRVLDLGLAVAGPWGTMMLADLGAEVIKVNQIHDSYWMSTHIGMSCNRGKKSISLNLKKSQGLEILYKLVASSDVVHHNMRYDAAERLGVDYESLQKVNPTLVYCHSRGFEHGPRSNLPGNDQTGAALAGPDWLDSGLDNEGIPFWPAVSLGDTGNGFLSAIATVQALWHRARTGDGQFVDTSIIYAHLLNASMSWDTRDGLKELQRPSLDAMQLGWSPWYRLYEASEGWLCIAAVDDRQRRGVLEVLGSAELSEGEITFHRLAPAFATRSAEEWVNALDDVGVPAEISDPDFVLGLFDDPEMIAKEWVTSYFHPVVGRLDQLGLLFDFSETPGVIQGPPFIPGQDTRAILQSLGLGDERIDELIEERVVSEASL